VIKKVLLKFLQISVFDYSISISLLIEFMILLQRELPFSRVEIELY